jgi:hypothetical protein
MTDPISGDAVRRVAGTAGQPIAEPKEILKQPGGKFQEVFEQKLEEQDAVRNTLQSNLQTQVDRMPPAERLRVEQEFQTRVAPLDRSEQARYFSTRLTEPQQRIQEIEGALPRIEPSPWKDKLVERLSDFQDEYTQLGQVLSSLSSGREFSSMELLAIQMKTHQMAQSLELLSKTVEHSVSGMKTIFQTNV